MLDKAISQMQELLQGRGIAYSETAEIVLQMLGWVKLSESKAIDEGLWFHPEKLKDWMKVMDIFLRLQKHGGLIGQAFLDVDKIFYRDPNIIQPMLELLPRLLDAGALKSERLLDIEMLWPAQGKIWFEVPPDLATLLVGLAGLEPSDSVYTPWDFAAQFATRAAAMASDVCLETPNKGALPALVSLLSAKPFQVKYSDPIRSPSVTENGTLKVFDKSIAFPPFDAQYERETVSQDWFGRFPEQTRSGGVLAIRQLLAQTRERAVVAVPNNVLFSAGAERHLREDLVRRRMIQAVIAMPPGLLRMTSLDFAILVLSPSGNSKKIQFINADASRFRETVARRSKLTDVDALVVTLGTRGPSDVSVQITTQDVLENDAQLQVRRYFEPEPKRCLQRILSASTTKAMDELIRTVRPMPVSSSGDDCVEAWEVGAADLPPVGYITAPGRMVRIDQAVAAKSERQFLQPFDIVLIVKGSVGKVGIVPEHVPPPGHGGWVAGQSAIVLRALPNAPIDPRALAMQLRSPMGQELLDGIVSGATIPLIQLRELAVLPVVVPNRDTAAHAISALEKEAELQQMIDQLKREQAAVATELWQLV